MKIIHYLNTLIYTACLLLIIGSYCLYSNGDLYGGYIIISMIVLGILQPFLAFIILLSIDWSNKKKKKNIIYYWSSVIVFFIITYIAAHMQIDFVLKILSYIPICIATYFVYVTYLIQKQ